jgi:hypothetical protein
MALEALVVADQAHTRGSKPPGAKLRLGGSVLVNDLQWRAGVCV